MPTNKSLIEEAEEIFTNLNNGLFNKQANTLTSTATTQAASVARQEVYRDNDIPRVEWVATLDDSVCEDCESLHGTQWPVDQAEIPPEHWNCRCVLEPVDE